MADITNALNEFKTAPNGESVRDAFVETMTLVNNDNIQIAGEYAEIVAVAGQLQPAVTSAEEAALLASQKATEANAAAVIATTKAAEITTAANTATTKAAEAVAAKDISVTKAGEATTAASTVVGIRDEILPKLNNIDQKVTDATDAATLSSTKASESTASAVTSSEQALISLNAAGTATTKASEANQSAIDAAESAAASGVTPEEKAIWNAKQDALGFTPENAANKGQVNGYAGLDGTGKVPLAQLPEIGSGSGDMLKSVYDANNNGVVDNSEKVNGLTVQTAVPVNALFTDTIKTPAEELTDIKTVDGEGSGLDSDLLDGKHASDFALTVHGIHVTYGDTTTALISGGTGVVGISPELAREDHTHTLPLYPDLAGHVISPGLHTTTEKQTEWNKNTTDIVVLQQQIGTAGANDAAARREIMDIKLKLDEMNVIEFLNKTGIGFFDLFEDTSNVDTIHSTAVISSTDVTFTAIQNLLMKAQTFSGFTNVELALYDMLREQFKITVDVNNTVDFTMNITQGSRVAGEKFYYNGEVYTIVDVQEI